MRSMEMWLHVKKAQCALDMRVQDHMVKLVLGKGSVPAPMSAHSVGARPHLHVHIHISVHFRGCTLFELPTHHILCPSLFLSYSRVLARRLADSFRCTALFHSGIRAQVCQRCERTV